MFDALRRSSLTYFGLRVENNAGFAADAYDRTTPEALAVDLAKSLAEPGPSVVVLPALLRMCEPTHP